MPKMMNLKWMLMVSYRTRMQANARLLFELGSDKEMQKVAGCTCAAPTQQLLLYIVFFIILCTPFIEKMKLSRYCTDVCEHDGTLVYLNIIVYIIKCGVLIFKTHVSSSFLYIFYFILFYFILLFFLGGGGFPRFPWT